MTRRLWLASLLALVLLVMLLFWSQRCGRRSGRLLHTAGNKILRADDTPWMGRGVNIPDTRSCGACEDSAESVREVERRIDEAVDVWHASFLRLCLRSEAPAESVLADEAYLDHVKQLVAYVGAKPDVYVLVSLWRDPSLGPQGWPTDETREVWAALARELYPEDHALYGVVNEPRENLDGREDGEVWRQMNETVLTIRNVEESLGGKRHVVVVQGTRDYGRSLDYYVEHPITAGGGEDVAYETHPYSPARALDSLIIAPSRKLPVIIGEFGPNDFGTTDFQMTYDDARAVLEVAERESIPYAAFSFHMRCPPNLLVDHSGGECGIGMPLEPTPVWGRMVMEFLARH